MRKFVAVLLLPVLLAGCASIVSHSEWPVALSTTPDGASVEVVNEAGEVVHRGVTPCTVTLSAHHGYMAGEDYTVRCKKDGCEDGAGEIRSYVNGWYMGNFLFGGLTGLLLVDPLTGSMWKLPPKVHIDLAPHGAATVAQPAEPPAAPTAEPSQ